MTLGLLVAENNKDKPTDRHKEKTSQTEIPQSRFKPTYQVLYSCYSLDGIPIDQKKPFRSKHLIKSTYFLIQ